ncbi:hypothetical protein RHMOL_Rhmol01G0170800 [Rhododendron molle]|uniref:Uncharacterized protein n=1 Tax=Rhododendron molle TaxID=49168 RepID=A0ACC0Q489_RHOML|nr:hypothetical protein RHMOL_Rhmol01G0170800 [Rhododendron molle]
MTRTRAMNEFCKCRPPTFNGDTNPTMVETWLKEVKVILDTLEITRDGDRVALATYQLKGEARYCKYFPMPLRLAKEQEFLNLKQGTMTVTQYAAKFEELSHYAPTAIATEDKKARRFEWGLTTARRAVVAQAFTAYTEVVKCVLRLESEETDFKTGGGRRIITPVDLFGPNHPTTTVGTTPPNPLTHLKATNHGRLLHQDIVNRRGKRGQQPGQADFVNQNPEGPSQQQNGQSKGKQPMRTQQGTGGRIFALQTEEQEPDPSMIQDSTMRQAVRWLKQLQPHLVKQVMRLNSIFKTCRGLRWMPKTLTYYIEILLGPVGAFRR